MKSLPSIILLGLITVGCSSNHKEKTKPFDLKEVCSDEALTYLQGQEPKTELARMMKVEPIVKQCYLEDVKKTGNVKPYNLCFVAGYDAKGKEEFFEFSSKEAAPSDDMKKCLEKAKKSGGLKGLANAKILQPFLLSPQVK